jgi:hypothetical protein
MAELSGAEPQHTRTIPGGMNCLGRVGGIVRKHLYGEYYIHVMPAPEGLEDKVARRCESRSDPDRDSGRHDEEVESHRLTYDHEDDEGWRMRRKCVNMLIIVQRDRVGLEELFCAVNSAVHVLTKLATSGMRLYASFGIFGF